MQRYTANWRKSSYSGTSSDCVEVADLGHGTAVRDTKHRDLGVLLFPAAEWQALLNTTLDRTSKETG
ncbi:DUF397 domain-containing protein [Nocardiopsis nanhaiensis]